MSVTLLQISGMEKIFLDTNYEKIQEIAEMTALKGERVSYQILYTHSANWNNDEIDVRVECENEIKTELRNVECVPVKTPFKGGDYDEFYERTTPGLYPDILVPINGKIICSESVHSLYITCSIAENIASGIHTVRLIFTFNDETVVKEMKIRVINCVMPKQDITYTEWFHTDCIADYYNLKVFSEEHWLMIEKFVKAASKTGINMILTPVFTPPLDTEKGGFRTAVQLVGVKYFNGKYEFDFDKLERWIKLCKENGIEKFEISHLFTQWGSGNAPQIIVTTENGEERKFGWHTDAVDDEYKGFLSCFLPELISFMKKMNVYENTYFHISDEPVYEKDLEIYKAEYGIINKFVPSEKIIDAMGDYKFCDEGLAKKPVVVTDKAEEFLNHGVKDMWVYYCCAPINGFYSNRLIAMPLGRTRILGTQLFKYDIKGFLHWGFNFYNTRFSKKKINPFMVTDAGEEFPSGDSFSVYPGENEVYESLRSEAFYCGLQDNRAYRLLESVCGREEAIKIIEASGEITFDKYPYSNRGIELIRERVNKKLMEIFS